MKKYLFLLACITFSISVFAQDEENKSAHIETDESKSFVLLGGMNSDLVFLWKKDYKKARERAEKEHWSGCRFEFINLEGLQGANLKQSQSYAISVMPIDVYHAISKHWLFVSGAEVEWARYHFGENRGLEGKSDYTHFAPAPEGFSYKSSKLLVYNINIPLVLEYQKKLASRHTFYISGGVEGLIKCYSKSQVDVRTPQGIQKTSLGRDLNLRPINMRFVLKVGIDDYGIFGYYQPFSMFENGKGPEVRSFGIGICTN
ncbi:hypothetical protein FACS1894123_07450 [Bacteroidia bacterium]|nr:hypothetical protein FACS1894123_07450 [Bacteroidia bacterium]